MQLVALQAASGFPLKFQTSTAEVTAGMNGQPSSDKERSVQRMASPYLRCCLYTKSASTDLYANSLPGAVLATLSTLLYSQLAKSGVEGPNGHQRQNSRHASRHCDNNQNCTCGRYNSSACLLQSMSAATRLDSAGWCWLHTFLLVHIPLLACTMSP